MSPNIKGLTLLEILISVILLSMIFLAVSALYVSSQMIFFEAYDKMVISDELQYVMEHVYNNVMKGIGDETGPPSSRALEISADNETLYITINSNNPLTRGNYSDTVTYTYSKSGTELNFDDGSGAGPESLVQKVNVESVNFSLAGNTLAVSLTGYYRDNTRPLTFYSACYPRLASFQ